MALQVFGGLIVGMVVKYADNILKNFANALSVIFTVIGAMPLFGQYPSIFFLFGVVGVLLSVCARKSDFHAHCLPAFAQSEGV